MKCRMNVTSKFNKYREVIRHLWNTGFYNDGTANWNDHEIFLEIDKLLFGQLVLNAIAETKHIDFTSASTMFRLKGTSNGLPVIVNRTGDGGYWDHPVTALVHDEYEIQFESYFDWDELGIKDCRYIASRILNSKKHPEIAGHKALVESHYVEIHLRDLPNSPPA